MRISFLAGLDSNNMKVTGVKTIVVNAEMRNWVFVKIETDRQGSYGQGKLRWNGKPEALSARWRISRRC
jgi:galactonate dehydratase